MTLLHTAAAFFAGAFLANVIPHLVHGISGDPFPTPFANPPGKGLSSPTVNVLWAFLNILIGGILFRMAQISADNVPALLLLFAGALALSVMCSISFQSKHTR